MALNNKNSRLYAVCKDIQRSKPEFAIDKDLAKTLGENYRTLPTFEKSMADYIYRNHYSLERNQLLKCRWKRYKQTYEARVFAPFQFPDIRDLHFYNGSVKYAPAQSVHTLSDFRNKLRVGPGVDFVGQLPVPEEMKMRRGNPVKKSGTKRKEMPTEMKIL